MGVLEIISFIIIIIIAGVNFADPCAGAGWEWCWMDADCTRTGAPPRQQRGLWPGGEWFVLCVWMYVSVCVRVCILCVCVCVREREVCVCVWERESVCVCVFMAPDPLSSSDVSQFGLPVWH